MRTPGRSRPRRASSSSCASAGIGSRFSAALIDFAIQGALLIAVIVLSALTLGSLGATIATSVGVLFAFVVYDVLFEVRAAGRTPGKRALGMRVVLADGAPVTLRASTVRNLIRLVEGVATFYVPAHAEHPAHARQPAARRPRRRARSSRARRRPPAGRAAPGPASCPSGCEAWDVSAVTVQELAAVRSFLARRHGFEPAARATLARRLADGLAPRVSGAPSDQEPERFLEDLAAAKSSKR